MQLCGYEGSDLREIVLEKPENRNKFIKQVEGEKPDMTDYQLASSLLAYCTTRSTPPAAIESSMTV